MTLREFRKSRNLTQRKLGEICNVSGQTVSSWEKGRTKMPQDMILLLESSYGIELEKSGQNKKRFRVSNSSPEASAKKYIGLLDEDQADLVFKAANNVIKSLSANFKIYAALTREGISIKENLDIHEKKLIEKISELYRVLKDLKE